MSHLNWVDYVILAIFFFSTLTGLMRGLVKEIISLITLIAAFTIATLFSNALAAYFTGMPGIQDAVSKASNAIGPNAEQSISYLALGGSFALLFVATMLLGTIIGFILNAAFRSGVLGIGNRILGGVFGLVRGYIINLVLIFLVQLTPFSNEGSWHQSQLVVFYQPAVIWLGNIVSPSLANLKAKFDKTLESATSGAQT